MGAMTGPLISVDELLSALRGEPGSPRPTVLDVRYRMGGPPGPGEYAAGHVPGAAYVDMDADLAAPPGDGGRHPLPHAGVFEAAMRRAGVSGARPVVVYDDWSGLAAGRGRGRDRRAGADRPRGLRRLARPPAGGRRGRGARRARARRRPGPRAV